MANPDYLYEYGALRTYVGGEIGEFWVYQNCRNLPKSSRSGRMEHSSWL